MHIQGDGVLKKYEVQHKNNKTVSVTCETTVEGAKKQIVFDPAACPHSGTSFILFTLFSSSAQVFFYRHVALGQKMPDTKSEQCVTITFLTKLKKYRVFQDFRA